ncbi:ABC transporter ATP-binding protein [Aliiroseovarius sp. YM-037]|uniref:ABC transporter ATP-binding protein n=1 Tax=Aliiroseovarius sp. YM-037 TaxID=3341728 RepID=UPI003A8082F6
MTLLHLDNLTVLRKSCPVVDQVSCTITEGEFVGLIGPNGAGKTTLMRAALGLLRHEGHSSLSDMTASARAHHAAWMPQAREIAWPVDVETLVALGRIPHLPRGARIRDTDRAAIDAALAQMGLDTYRHRVATRLSGGEQARVLIARMLAQETPLLIADEPIAGLDPANQITTMRLFAELAEGGRTVVASLHDLGLAARHCTRLLLLNKGQLVADGPPDEVLKPENISAVFGVSAFFRRTDQGIVFQPLETLE